MNHRERLLPTPLTPSPGTPGEGGGEGLTENTNPTPSPNRQLLAEANQVEDDPSERLAITALSQE